MKKLTTILENTPGSKFNFDEYYKNQLPISELAEYIYANIVGNKAVITTRLNRQKEYVFTEHHFKEIDGL